MIQLSSSKYRVRNTEYQIDRKAYCYFLDDPIQSVCSLVKKTTYDGYPLKVEYFLTERGKKIFEAISIMQHVGIEIMQEDNKTKSGKEE